MKSQNLAFLSLKFIARDLIGDLLYWPIWWYSVGLVHFVKKRWLSLKSFEANTGLTIWVVNWFKPMYGQYDLAGKVISFVVRTAGIIFKFVQVVFDFLIELILIVVWLLLPVLAVYQIIKLIFWRF